MGLDNILNPYYFLEETRRGFIGGDQHPWIFIQSISIKQFSPNYFRPTSFHQSFFTLQVCSKYFRLRKKLGEGFQEGASLLESSFDLFS